MPVIHVHLITLDVKRTVVSQAVVTRAGTSHQAPAYAHVVRSDEKAPQQKSM